MLERRTRGLERKVYERAERDKMFREKGKRGIKVLERIVTELGRRVTGLERIVRGARL